jgi:putative hemolysin
MPEGDRMSTSAARYDTLGGLILATNEDIPQAGEVIEFSPFTFTIMSMDGTRIDTVKVRLNKE